MHRHILHTITMTNNDTRSTYGAMPDVEGGNPPVMLSESLLMSGPKQGHSFCGCCCDVRRATIIVNIVLLVFDLLTVADIFYLISFSQYNTDSIQDDTLRHELEVMDFPSYLIPLLIAELVIRSLSSIAAIVGAMKYNAWLVSINIVYLTISLILGLVGSVQSGTLVFFIIWTVPLQCFYIYPHVMLVHEIKGSKTMSKQTYPREEQSCCCVPTKYRDNVY